MNCQLDIYKQRGLKMLNTKLKNELITHIIVHVNYCDDDHDFSELHYECFNQDYYIIGYYEASEWLKLHDINAFDAIEYVQDYEQSNFGEVTTKINSESIVNMLVYILGEEVINELDIELDACTKQELLTSLGNLAKE